MKHDTNVDCDSPTYASFVITDLLLIIVYQSVPLVWCLILLQSRGFFNSLSDSRPKISCSLECQSEEAPKLSFFDSMSPTDERGSNIWSSLSKTVEAPSSNEHVAFLMKDYRPSFWYFEIVDIYRRMVFICMLPLVASSTGIRAATGCLLSVIFIMIGHISSPFNVEFVNVLFVTSLYQVCRCLSSTLQTYVLS